MLLIPSGNSKIALADILNKVDGSFSLNSEIKNTLKSLWALFFIKYYSISLTQVIAKWTFFSITQEPVFIDLSKAFSAYINPSELPKAIAVKFLFNSFATETIWLEGSNPGALFKKTGFLDEA